MLVVAEKTMRYTLGALLMLVALNAFGGGIYGMAGAKNIPTQWLKATPFKSYLVPSFVLFVCVGGSALFASVAVLNKKRYASGAVVVCAIVMLVWIGAQVAIIGYTSWLQPAVAIVGIFILILNYVIKKYSN